MVEPLENGTMNLTCLKVNLNDETASALKSIAAQKGISFTEAVRRAIAVLKFATDAAADGKTILVADADGSNKRELVLM